MSGPYSLPTVLYATSPGDAGVISVNDIHQGSYDDCYLCASIGELAMQDPAAILNMIRDNGDGTQTVTLYQDYTGAAPGFGASNYKAVQVTVDDTGISASGLNGGSWDVVNGSKEIWPQVIELAYAQQNGGYDAIGKGGFASLAMEQLTGVHANFVAASYVTAASLAANLANGDLVTFDTPDTSGLPFNLVQDHGYMLEGLQDVGGVECAILGNPWGYDQPAAVPVSQVAAAFAQIEIGHTGTPETAVPPPAGGLVLEVSEDAWMGDAQFTVTVDGMQREGTYTATAPHGTGADPQRIELGPLGAGQHSVGVTFVNDAWGGSASTDRNLYVDGATYDGRLVSGSTGTLLSDGTFSFGVAVEGAPTPPTAGKGLAVFVQEDAWQGDAQFTVSIDGQQIGGAYTATQPHGAASGGSQGQEFDFNVQPGTGRHQVGITFINDAWGGTAAADRNLYVTGAAFDGQAVPGSGASLYSNGTAYLSFESGSPSGSDPLQGISLSLPDILPGPASPPPAAMLPTGLLAAALTNAGSYGATAPVSSWAATNTSSQVSLASHP